MDIPSGRWSTGAIMLVIVPIALELVVFQGVWSIVLLPFMAIALLTVNQGLFFVLVRPRSWQTRIVGMLLGGLAATVASIFLCVWEFLPDPAGRVGPMVQQRLFAWAASLPDPGGEIAAALRFIARRWFAIAAMLLDILGIAMIWAGGRLEHACRSRRAERRAARDPATPRGEPALTP